MAEKSAATQAAAEAARAAAVHIDADEVHVESAVELPEGHVIVEPPTAATPALARPSTDVRDAEVAAESETSLSAQGRREETILRTSGQRKINLVWEATQAVVTIMVVASTLFIAGSLVLNGKDSDNRAAAFLLLSNAFFMIVTAYYQRTNHTRTGGVGGSDVRSDR